MTPLGLKRPIMLAPMAGEPANAGFLRAAMDAGIYGGLGAAYLEPEAITALDATLPGPADTPLAYQINLFVPQPAPQDRDRSGFEAFLREQEATLGLAPSAPANWHGSDFDAQLAAALATRAETLSFTFGLPSESVVRAVKAAGKQVWVTINTAEEARQAEACGADGLLAQGFEAGGHRGGPARDPSTTLVGTLALIPAVVDAVSIPVVAAGGIADGRGLAAILCLGAAAAAIGTAFLTADESPISDGWKDRIIAAPGEGTALTRAYSGRWARGVETAYMRAGKAIDVPDFPLTNSLTGPMRKGAKAAGDLDRQSLWSGQSGQLSRRESLSAIADRIENQARAILPAAFSG